MPATIKSRSGCLDAALSEDIPDDHRNAMEGWKSRKDQLHRQKQSVTEVNDEAEKVNLLSLSKQKGGK